VVVRGVRADPPKEVLQNFLGVNYLLRGSNPPDLPLSNTALLPADVEHIVKQSCVGALKSLSSFLVLL